MALYACAFWGLASGTLFAVETTALLSGLRPFRVEIAWTAGLTAAVLGFAGGAALFSLEDSDGLALAKWLILSAVVGVAAAVPPAERFAPMAAPLGGQVLLVTPLVLFVWMFSVPEALAVGFVGFFGVWWVSSWARVGTRAPR